MVDDDEDQDAKPSRGTHFVKTLERGLAVIRAFDADSPELTLSALARKVAMTRASARRFLLTLEDLGYVESDGRLFRLTPHVLHLGYSYLSSIPLPDIALPHLEQLVASVRDTSEVSILDGDDIVYVLRVPGPSIVTLAINVGARMPAYATSMGRVLLAGLCDTDLEAYIDGVRPSPLRPSTVTDKEILRERILDARQDGFAIIDDELEDGLRAVAVPIRDRGGQVVAAANVSTHAGRRTLASVEADLLPQLRATVERIEAELGASAPGRSLAQR